MATPEYQSEEAQSPGESEYYDDPPEEEIIDLSREGDEQPRVKPEVKQAFRPNEDSTPAHVSPIPKVGRISPIQSNQNGGISSEGRPQIPSFLLSPLVNRVIDEYGEIVDDEGEVLARVAGDLPAMVGKTVSNKKGDVLDDDGELLGYIVGIGPDPEEKDDDDAEGGDGSNEAPNPTKSLDEFTQGGSGAFRVDSDGNILDGAGNVVGKFHDNGGGPSSGARGTGDEGEKSGGTNTGGPSRPNAQSFRRENESPSDIFLDVKSTTEGIQLTIRIPTVFPGGGRTPKVQFS